MQKKSVASLTLNIEPSRRLACLVGICHGLAAIAVLASPLPWWGYVLVMPWVLVSGVVYWRRNRHGAFPRRIRIDAAGQWKLWLPSDDEAEAGLTLLPGSIVVPWLLLLHFRLQNGRFYALPLMPDSLEPDGFRKLMVRLRTLAPN